MSEKMANSQVKFTIKADVADIDPSIVDRVESLYPAMSMTLSKIFSVDDKLMLEKLVSHPPTLTFTPKGEEIIVALTVDLTAPTDVSLPISPTLQTWLT